MLDLDSGGELGAQVVARAAGRRADGALRRGDVGEKAAALRELDAAIARMRVLRGYRDPWVAVDRKAVA